LFWDINFDHLDSEIHKRVIIERVLSFGNLQEFFLSLEPVALEHFSEIIGFYTTRYNSRNDFPAISSGKGPVSKKSSRVKRKMQILRT